MTSHIAASSLPTIKILIGVFRYAGSNDFKLSNYWRVQGKTPGSEKLSMEANEVLPSGIAHDSRYLKPYALYIDKADGPHKWDVDGNRYVDYFGGHGALLLGHCHPEVTEAVQSALGAGTQFGANHPREVEWANQVIKMVPSVERVRFTSSGTEATLMALRLSRSFTGKTKFIRFKIHIFMVGMTI